MRERVVVLAVSIAIYFVLGVALGALEPRAWKLAAACLYAPLLAVLAFFGLEALGAVDFLLLVGGFALGDLAAALAGTLLGSRLRMRRSAETRV
jgi:CDP-diglyceride synthetase